MIDFDYAEYIDKIDKLCKLIHDFHDKLVYICMSANSSNGSTTLALMTSVRNKFKKDASKILTKELIEHELDSYGLLELGFSVYESDTDYMRVPTYFLEILPKGLAVYVMGSDHTLKPAIVGKDCIYNMDEMSGVFITYQKPTF